MSQNDFVHLHCHTGYSLLDSMIRIDSLVAKVKDMGQKAVSITDHGNLAGAVKFTDACKKAGIKPILGIEAYIAPDSRHRHKYPRVPTGEFDENTGKEIMRDAHSASHLILLAQNAKGWDNLRTLSTLSYTEGFYKKPRIDHELLARYSEGLIATTACMGGDISIYLKAGLDADGEGKVEFQPHLAAAKLAWYVSHFGDRFFIELQEHGEFSAQAPINDWYRERYPAEMMFASADCHYLNAEDFDTHDTLLCCGTVKHKHDPNRWRFPTDQAWLKTTQEMAELFYPHELANTVKIADMIEFELPLRKQFFMPELPGDITAGATPTEVFTRECIYGLMLRRHGDEALSHADDAGFSFLDLYDDEDKVYKDRLDYEMGVFIKAGFVEYALILWDLMRYCKENYIFTGDGRGSGAGSLVLYALRIVNVDPIERDCPFERFINPGRLENFAPPDVDLDFPKTKRQQVIQYLRDRYGEERVCHIGTYASLGPSGLIRKLSVPLGIDPQTTAKLTSIIPEGEASQQGSGAASEMHGLSLDDVWKQSDAFRKLIEKMGDQGKWLLHYARGLRNLGTHASTHASGILIANRPIRDFIPMMVAKANTKDALTLAQFDMFDAEAIGLIKYDVLGLDVLDVLSDVQRKVREQEDASFDFEKIDLDDPSAYDVLNSGRTAGIFQASGGGFGRLLPQAKPRTVEDLAVLTSLCRPGPTLAGATETYLRRRQGVEAVTYTIPQLEPILGKNFGVLAFQEDIMAIAHQLAGFTLAEADELRKAMGKKDAAKMNKQRPKFVDGLASCSGISAEEGEKLWNQLVPMAEYVFNRSHAMAYSYTTAKCAYAKAHYPAYFLAAAMTADTTGTNSGANLPIFVRDAQAVGTQFLAPDINKCQEGYLALDRSSVLLGLLSIRGVGEVAAAAILAERERGGAFTSRDDWRVRLPLRAANKTAYEALILAGAFDNLEGVKRESTTERLHEEFALFGFYLSGHPCERSRAQWQEESPDLVTLADIEADFEKERGFRHTQWGRKQVWQFKEKHVRAVVSRIEKKKSKKTQGFMLMLDVEDETHSMKMIVNSGQLQKFGNPTITKGSLLDMVGRKEDPARWANYFGPTGLVVLG